MTYMYNASESLRWARPYCWVREDGHRELTLRQARAVAASEYCTQSGYIHPVGDPETKFTTRSDIDDYVRARENGERQG